MQGERSKTIGVVDAEYIVHKGIPTLGGFDLYKVWIWFLGASFCITFSLASATDSVSFSIKMFFSGDFSQPCVRSFLMNPVGDQTFLKDYPPL